MKHYAECTVFNAEDAKNKALRNADLHARNCTANDPRPRFIVRKDGAIVGFVRVGGAENPWVNQELEQDFLRNGFIKDGDQWFDQKGDAVTDKGIGEIAILLREEQTNKGLGRLLMTAMVKIVMPACKRLRMRYDDLPVGYIMSTVSAENRRSKSILADHFICITDIEKASHYNSLKLFYLHEIENGDISMIKSIP
jgi:hypothetical protein